MNIDDKDRELGLYGKFKVTRTDGSSKKGQKHAGCEYFVLDINHDPFVRYALAAYLDAARLAYPQLAADLRGLVRRNMFDTTQRWNELANQRLISPHLYGQMLPFLVGDERLVILDQQPLSDEVVDGR